MSTDKAASGEAETMKREGRLVRATAYAFSSFDEPWCTTGMPLKELPEGIVFVCGQPEMQHSIVYDQTSGKIKTHFQGFVMFEEYLTIPEARAKLGLDGGSTHLFPVAAHLKYRAIDFTRKMNVSLSDDEGKLQWRYLGVMPTPNAAEVADRLVTVTNALAAAYKK